MDSNKKNNLDDTLKIKKLKKLQNEELFNLLQHKGMEDIGMTDDTKRRIDDCGSFLEFIGDIKSEKHRLVNANFCKNRFCPHCSYNKARKDAYETMIISKYIESLGYKFIFLTLTSPNVPAAELEDELKDFSESFKRLTELKKIKKINKGYLRKLEITYNADRDDYHPHYHVMIAVNKSYFTDSNYYISQAEWLEYWKKAKRDESITQVDVRKYRSNDKGIFEITKYIAKDSNYLHSEEVFKTFYRALKGKRMYSYNKIFKTARTKLKNGELDHLRDVDSTEYFYKVWFVWNQQKYENISNQFLTLDELKKYNTKYKKDIDIE